MTDKPQHGGKRSGAGAKPGTGGGARTGAGRPAQNIKLDQKTARALHILARDRGQTPAEVIADLVKATAPDQ